MFPMRNLVSDMLQAELQVTSKTVLSDGVVALSLVHRDGRRLLDWTLGSHIDVVLPSGITRQYSLCGDRWDAYTYRIGVLHEEGGRGGSSYIHKELSVGTTVALSGPRNNFALELRQRRISRGAGVLAATSTPVL
jgi:ferredoxin-NADP reductase